MLDHVVQISADNYVPVEGDDLLPTGKFVCAFKLTRESVFTQIKLGVSKSNMTYVQTCAFQMF